MVESVVKGPWYAFGLGCVRPQIECVRTGILHLVACVRLHRFGLIILWVMMVQVPMEPSVWLRN